MAAGRPLAALTVVEIGHSVAAPVAGMILAGLGAEVVKIERPGRGDDARGWGPPFHEGIAAVFHAVNRNKRSATVDFRDPAQLAGLRRFIIERADVVLQNLRPGAVERLGLDAAGLREDKPQLIYCNIGAYGRTGPMAGKPGYDPLMQAFGGIMSVTGEAGREPVRVGPSIVDQGTGMWAVIGILAALAERHRTGHGCEVDTSLFETAVSWMGMHVAQYEASGEVPGRLGSGNFGIVPYQAYRAADDWLIIAAGNDALFARLAEALGRPSWAEDPDFRHNDDRVRHRARLDALIAEAVAAAPRAIWIERLETARVPCAPLQSVDQVMDHPQTAATGILQTVGGDAFRLPGLPVAFDRVRPPARSPAPALGATLADLAGEAPLPKAAER